MSLSVRTSSVVNPGAFIWTRGSDVIGISTADRAKFLGQFGLVPNHPPEADGVIMSETDYLLVIDPLPSTPSNQEEQP